MHRVRPSFGDCERRKFRWESWTLWDFTTSSINPFYHEKPPFRWIQVNHADDDDEDDDDEHDADADDDDGDDDVDDDDDLRTVVVYLFLAHVREDCGFLSFLLPILIESLRSW